MFEFIRAHMAPFAILMTAVWLGLALFDLRRVMEGKGHPGDKLFFFLASLGALYCGCYAIWIIFEG